MKPNINQIKESKTILELLEFSIINLDKPAGPTSFGVDEIMKKILDVNKAAHFGTLDPNVTGVLPVSLNRACRLMHYFIGKNKEYVGIMKLHKETDEKTLKEEIKNFIGKIIQLPPKKSRVKREERERSVFNFEILEFNKENKEVLFKTEVEAGTYIRKLIHDLGKSLGGAHMSELRRTKASIFSEQDKNFTNLYQLEEAIKEYKRGNEKKLREILIPGEITADILPAIQVKEEAIKKLYNGSPLFQEFLQEEKQSKNLPEIFAIFHKDIFIGTYKKANEGNIIAWPEFVLRPDKKPK
ncbi:RNA-guided pseudouridylation complex pseudouridine synthase subunit Cbf5 [Candidatus Woesearchaeota archaeon CG10_big_fil_rev_8_21_14_0_10_34_12]|nr:MAG: RNA-guided pseudouridylation complex pseudouridine synthase subunit Cbf5 [Candidatus Woesearchaeota archaeon CG10_big_fil_rev_8_21_14_0_10_34_12]